jgi:hypothetical protein
VELHFTLLPAPVSPVQEYGDDWVNTCPRRLYDKAMHTLMKQAGQQIVILSQVRGLLGSQPVSGSLPTTCFTYTLHCHLCTWQVLVDDINTGYQQLQNLQVGGVYDTNSGKKACLNNAVNVQGHVSGWWCQRLTVP